MEPCPEAPEDISTIVLLENSGCTPGLIAARAARHLPGAWSALLVSSSPPHTRCRLQLDRPSRYRWFGKRISVCADAGIAGTGSSIRFGVRMWGYRLLIVRFP